MMSGPRLLKSRLARRVAIGVSFALAAYWLLVPFIRGVRTQIESQRPYIIEFGRGSGWHGLNTIKVLQDGTAILHQGSNNSWETATLTLAEESLVRVRDAVEQNRLLELRRAYHGNVADGTQWVLRIQQDGREKAVYFDNIFPEPIEKFAETLDAVLAKNGLDKAAWHPVSYLRRRGHERDLWDSIRR